MRLIADYVVPGEGTGLVIAGGAIDIDSRGRIVAVGTETDLATPTGTVNRIGGILIPGLVNAHAHGPMTLLRSAGDGWPLMQWLTEAVWPREANMTADEATIGMCLAMCEQLLYGVTTSTEMYLFEDSIAAAAEIVGCRVQIMAGLISVMLPDSSSMGTRLAAIDEMRRFNHDQDSRVTVGYGAHSVYDLGPRRLEHLREHAEFNDAIVHVHLEETSGERNQVIEQYGRSATEILYESGLLDGRLVAAHGVWLSDSDMRLLAQTEAAVIHCPSSNLKLGSGVARVTSMLQAGIRVGLGTDGAASNDDLNLWEDMRLAAMLARGTSHDAAAMSAAAVFSLATDGGARAAGIADVGELRVGAWADIVRLDLDDPAYASGVEADLFNNLVWAGGPHQVTDVWVAGNQVVADREITTIDRRQLQANAKLAATRLL